LRPPGTAGNLKTRKNEEDEFDKQIEERRRIKNRNSTQHIATALAKQYHLDALHVIRLVQKPMEPATAYLDPDSARRIVI
jgi:hypothetical protein